MCLGMVCNLSIDCHLQKAAGSASKIRFLRSPILKDLERNRWGDKEMTIALRRHDIPSLTSG
jgi:hypothetical protein